MKKSFKILFIVLLAMIHINVVPVHSAMNRVEVTTWKELKVALEKSETLEIYVSKDTNLYHFYDYTEEMAEDLQIEVKGKKHLIIDGIVHFRNSIDMNKGLICLWNENSDLTISGEGTIRYTLNHYIEYDYAVIEEGLLFQLIGGTLTIDDNISVVVTGGLVDVPHRFVQTVFGGYKGTVYLNGGYLYGNTIINEGLDVYVNGTYLDTAGQYENEDFAHEGGTLHLQSGTFKSGIGNYGGNIVLEEGSVWVNTDGSVSTTFKSKTAGAIWQKGYKSMKPENPDHDIDLGTIQYGQEELIQWQRYSYPTLPVAWNLDFNEYVSLYKGDELVFTKTGLNNYRLKNLLPGDYEFKLISTISKNGSISYQDEYIYRFKIVNETINELYCYVDSTPGAYSPNVYSDVAGLKIYTTWYLDEDNYYPLGGTPLIQNGYYYLVVEIESKDGECDLATNADVYVNGIKATPQDSKGVYKVKIKASNLQRYFDLYDLQKPVPGLHPDFDIVNDSAHYQAVQVKWYQSKGDEMVQMNQDDVFEKNGLYQVRIEGILQDGYQSTLVSTTINREDADFVFTDFVGNAQKITLAKNYDTSYCIDEVNLYGIQYPLPYKTPDTNLNTDDNTYEILDIQPGSQIEWYHENGPSYSLHNGKFDATQKRYQAFIQLKAKDGYYFAQDEQGRITANIKIDGVEAAFRYMIDSIQDDGTCTQIELARTFEKASTQDCVFMNGIALYDGMYLEEKAQQPTTNQPTTNYVSYKDGIVTFNEYHLYDKNGADALVSYQDLTIESNGNIFLYTAGDGIVAYQNVKFVGDGFFNVAADGLGLLGFGDVEFNDGELFFESMNQSGMRIINDKSQKLILNSGVVSLMGKYNGLDADDLLPVQINGGSLYMSGVSACYQLDVKGEDIEIYVQENEKFELWDQTTSLIDYPAVYILKEQMDLELKASAKDYKTIQLKWNDISADSYLIYRKTYQSDEFKLIEEINTCSYESTVMTGKDYQYYVVAMKNGKEVSTSKQVTMKTQLYGTVQLTMEKVSDSRFKLDWNKVDGATRYIVYRKRNDDKMKKVLTLGASELIYTTAELPHGSYKFIVKAGRYDSKDRVMTDSSNTVSGSVAKSKPTITLTPGTKQIKVSWKKLEGVTNYEVYQATSKSGTYKKLKTTTATSYTSKSLVKGKEYFYKVRGYKLYKSGDTISYNVYSEESSIKSAKAK